MAKFKVVSSGSKLKTIVKGLPKDLSQEGEPFKALRGKKKGDSTETIGIFFGAAREGDFTKEKGKLVSGQFFQGHLKRSSKDPDSRLVLVTANSGSPLNELVRQCIKDASLKHKVVSIKPGGPEPDNVDEEQDGKPTPTSPELEQIKDKLSARLPDILLLKKDAQKGAQVTKLLEDVQTHIKDEDHAKAGTAMDDLMLLVKPPQPTPKTPPQQQPKVQQPERPKTPPQQQPKGKQPEQPKGKQPEEPKVQPKGKQPEQPKGKPGADAPTKTEPDPLVAQLQEEIKKHPKYQTNMTRQGAEKLLENAPHGAWVLRWGNQVKQVVVSVKKEDGVRHVETIGDGKSVALGDLLKFYKEKNLYPAGKPPEDDSESRWKSRRPLLQPRLLEALSSPTADTSRMRALIAFADEKASLGEHKKALQSLDAIEDLLATAPKTPTPKGARPTTAPKGTAPIAKFTQALAAPKLDSSDFILLSMDMLRGALGEEADKHLNAVSAKYQEQDYEGAFKGLIELAGGSEEKLGGDVVALMKSKSTALRDDPTANQSRRFYETRLATHLEEELKTSGAFRSVGGMRDVIAKQFQAKGRNVSLPAVNSPEDAQTLIGLICRFNDNIEMGLKEDSPAYQSKDRLERPKEKTGDGTKEIDKLSRNPGVMKANAPNFTDLVSEQDSKNRVPERNAIDASKKEGYSAEHPEVPFVASISGTTFTLVALLDDYMKANANDASLGTNVSNIVKSFMAFYIKNGFHSYSEMQDVLREKNIKEVFTKYNVAVDLGVSDAVRDKTNKDAQDYAKGVSLKGAMQAELTGSALALLKQGEVATYEERPGKVYVAFDSAEAMNAAAAQVTKEYGAHTFRLAGRENTLEIYADLQRLLHVK